MTWHRCILMRLEAFKEVCYISTTTLALMGSLRQHCELIQLCLLMHIYAFMR